MFHITQSHVLKAGFAVAGSSVVVSAVTGGSVYIPIWAALILALSAIGAPVVNYLVRQASKHEDWRRLDEVAKHVQEVAIVEKAAREQYEKTALETQAVVKSTHHLVDGQLTASMQRDLNTKRSLLVLLKEKHDNDPQSQTYDTIVALESEIEELSKSIATRKQLLKESENQLKSDHV